MDENSWMAEELAVLLNEDESFNSNVLLFASQNEQTTATPIKMEHPKKNSKKRKCNPDSEIIAAETDETLKALALDPNSKEGKLQRRKIRNRLSAQYHRERKNMNMLEAQQLISRMENEIVSLKTQINFLLEENELLRKRDSSLAPSAQIFSAFNVQTSSSSTPNNTDTEGSLHSFDTNGNYNEYLHNGYKSDVSSYGGDYGNYTDSSSLSQSASPYSSPFHIDMECALHPPPHDPLLLLPTINPNTYVDTIVPNLNCNMTDTTATMNSTTASTYYKPELTSQGTILVPAALARPLSLITMVCMVSIMLLSQQQLPQLTISLDSISQASSSSAAAVSLYQHSSLNAPILLDDMTSFSNALAWLGMGNIVGRSISGNTLTNDAESEGLPVGNYDGNNDNNSAESSGTAVTTTTSESRHSRRRRLLITSSSDNNVATAVEQGNRDILDSTMAIASYDSSNSPTHLSYGQNDFSNSLTTTTTTTSSSSKNLTPPPPPPVVVRLNVQSIPLVLTREAVVVPSSMQLLANDTTINSILSRTSTTAAAAAKETRQGNLRRSVPTTATVTTMNNNSTGTPDMRKSNSHNGSVEIYSAGIVSRGIVNPALSTGSSSGSGSSMVPHYNSAAATAGGGAAAANYQHWPASSAFDYYTVQSYSTVVLTEGKALLDPSLDLGKDPFTSWTRPFATTTASSPSSAASATRNTVKPDTLSTTATAAATTTRKLLDTDKMLVPTSHHHHTLPVEGEPVTAATPTAASALLLNKLLSESNFMTLQLPASSIRVGKTWSDSIDGTVESIMAAFNITSYNEEEVEDASNISGDRASNNGLNRNSSGGYSYSSFDKGDSSSSRAKNDNINSNGEYASFINTFRHYDKNSNNDDVSVEISCIIVGAKLVMSRPAAVPAV